VAKVPSELQPSVLFAVSQWQWCHCVELTSWRSAGHIKDGWRTTVVWISVSRHQWRL